MLKNYIKIAFRNIRRNRIYSTISVLGLAIGITGATLLYLYVNDELNYDNFHEKADRIYRIVEISEKADQETRYFGQTAPVLGTTLQDLYPEIQEMIRVYQPVGHIDMLWKGERIHERNYLIADPGLFKVFDFEFIEGNEENPLADPNSVVISERIAQRLFGNENPIGQELPLRNITPAPLITVKGIIKNIPENSHLQFDYLLSREITGIDWTGYLNNWSASGAYTYLLLDPSVNMEQFDAKLDNFVKTRMEANPDAPNFYLQPLTDIYFNSAEIEFGVESAHGNIFYITIFSAIG
ncbi:MAG: ABC transporter permease, partial [Balneolaceae bacterium]